MNSGYFLASIKSMEWDLGVWFLVPELKVIGSCGRGTDVGLLVGRN